MKHILPKLCLWAVAACCITSQANAQYVSTFNGKLEVGLNIGPSNFLGDLGGTRGIGKTFLKDNNIEFTKILAGGFITYYPREWFGIRANFHHTKIEANDAVIKDKGGLENARRWRNLNFRSSITEAYIAAEITPTFFLEKDDYREGKLRPYALVGIGLFSYNPQTQLNGEWVDLRPLRTEGQGFAEYPNKKVYGKTAYCYPVGGGFKYYLTEKFTIGAEVIHRFTNTDYIDDVSTTYIDPATFATNLDATNAALARQLHNRNIVPTNVGYSAPGAQRGDSKDNDGYFSAVVKFGWRLGSEYQSEYRRARKQVRCSNFY